MPLGKNGHTVTAELGPQKWYRNLRFKCSATPGRRHEARLEQSSRMVAIELAQQMRVDSLGDARLPGEAFDHGLHSRTK